MSGGPRREPCCSHSVLGIGTLVPLWILTHLLLCLCYWGNFSINRCLCFLYCKMGIKTVFLLRLLPGLLEMMLTTFWHHLAVECTDIFRRSLSLCCCFVYCKLIFQTQDHYLNNLSLKGLWFSLALDREAFCALAVLTLSLVKSPFILCGFCCESGPAIWPWPIKWREKCFPPPGNASSTGEAVIVS